MRTTFINTLIEEAKKDSSIWLLNADLGFSVLEPFEALFPDRYCNVGVAEQNMIGVAAGLSSLGAKVFVYSIANFATIRCLEQIRVDVCYHNMDVVVVAVGGGFAYGSQGYTHHAIEDLAAMRSLPGMRVAAPGDPAETKAIVQTFCQQNGPGYIRLGRNGEPMLHKDLIGLPLKDPIMLCEGSEVVIFSTGAILQECLKSAELLRAQGISCEVVSVPILKPLDPKLILDWVASKKLVVTVEEHSIIGGLRDTIAPIIASYKNTPPLLGFGVTDNGTKGVILDQENMRAFCGIDKASVAARIAEALQAD